MCAFSYLRHLSRSLKDLFLSSLRVIDPASRADLSLWVGTLSVNTLKSRATISARVILPTLALVSTLHAARVQKGTRICDSVNPAVRNGIGDELGPVGSEEDGVEGHEDEDNEGERGEEDGGETGLAGGRAALCAGRQDGEDKYREEEQGQN